MARTDSLVAQTYALGRECERRGWTLVGIVNDPAVSAKTLNRPALHSALRRLCDGEADVLMSSHLDRLTRSVVDLEALLDWLDAADRRAVTIEDDLDTDSHAKRNVARLWASVAQMERTRISRRTKEGLAANRARGRTISRPSIEDHPELAARIRAMHGSGLSLHAVARQLNLDGVPTIRGGTMWRASSVQVVLGYQRPERNRRSAPLPDPRGISAS